MMLDDEKLERIKKFIHVKSARRILFIFKVYGIADPGHYSHK